MRQVRDSHFQGQVRDYVVTANGQRKGAAGYVNRLYTGSACVLSCNVFTGTPIALAASDVIGINLALDPAAAAISGTVSTLAIASQALVNVLIFDAAGAFAGKATSDSLGQ